MDRLSSELVDRACRRWASKGAEAAAERRLEPAKPRGFTIAVSREAGTPGSVVAAEVGKLLGWQVYDQELLHQIADEMGLRESLLESVDERQQSWLRESIQASLAALASGSASPWASVSSFVHHLVETVLALGVHGECVIVGRGAGFILPKESTLRVRLVSPIHDRIVALSRKLDITERQAAHRVRTIDRQRNDFVRDHFQKDPTDPQYFDLILNTSRLSVEDATQLVIETLNRVKARLAAATAPAGEVVHAR
jgi:cytidylate kinase